MASEIIQPPLGPNEETKPLDITSSQQEITTSPSTDAVQEMIRQESFKVKDSLATNSVTVLGIFASFIAFLTIEVQILKTVCDYLRILGFSMFILGAVLLFVVFIIYFTDSQNKKTIQIVTMSLVAGVMVFAGVFFVARGEDEYVCKLNRLDGDFQNLQIKLQKDNETWLLEKTKEFNLLKESGQIPF